MLAISNETNKNSGLQEEMFFQQQSEISELNHHNSLNISRAIADTVIHLDELTTKINQAPEDKK
jgi:hypothetical protein